MVAIFIMVWMLVIRGVPFPIIERLQVSVPLNSRPVAYYRKGGITPCLRLFKRSPALVSVWNTWASLAIFSVPDVDHDDSQLFFLSLVPSSVQLTLTGLACGSLAGSF